MKRLKSAGLGSKSKQAEPLTEADEEKLWQAKVLRHHSPQALLNTIIYMNGVYFALRSGAEHRQLRYKPCQIQMIEHPGERPYLEYSENVSKNHPGGLKSRKIRPKIVQHHGNPDNPGRCFVHVHLLKLSNSLCPANRPDHAFTTSQPQRWLLVFTHSTWAQQTTKCCCRDVLAGRYPRISHKPFTTGNCCDTPVSCRS